MKKLLKRLAAAALTGIMVLSMSAFPAYAADNGTIVITNPSVDVAYSAYKIFDMDYSGSNYAYTIDSSSSFFTAVQTYASANTENDNNGLTLTQVGESSTYNVTVDTTFSAASFGAAMKTAAASATAAATGTGSSTTTNLTLSSTLPYGYYLVVGTKGETTETLVSLDSTNTTAYIVEKNDAPGWHPEDPNKPDDAKGKTIKIKDSEDSDKYVETTSLNIGDEVTFAIKIDAKNYNGKNLITSYIIKDSLPAGFTFKSITSVKVDNGDVADYTTSGIFASDSTSNSGIGTITIPWATSSDNTSWTSKYDPSTLITIEYTATLNSNAVIDGAGNTNKATFSYTYGKTPENPTPDPDPEIPTDPSQWTDTDTATVYTYAIAIKKINKNGDALAGATFSLPDGMKVSAVTDKANTYIVAKDGSFTSITTSTDNGADASFTIIGVAEGTYKLTETKAPTGYNKLTQPVSVEAQLISKDTTTTKTTFYLDADGNVVKESEKVTGEEYKEVSYENTYYAVTPYAVVNFTGAELPSTGGVGTTMFYVVGGILVIGAAILLVTKRRMSAHK